MVGYGCACGQRYASVTYGFENGVVIVIVVIIVVVVVIVVVIVIVKLIVIIESFNGWGGGGDVTNLSPFWEGTVLE